MVVQQIKFIISYYMRKITNLYLQVYKPQASQSKKFKYLSISASVLLSVSEFLPFTNTRANGIIHGICQIIKDNNL